jgi:hypothetical protein
MSLTAQKDFELDDEDDESPFVEFEISATPADPTLEVLVNRLIQGDIVIPEYQRRFVWTIKQASRLIESFLMNLPVPQVFLYVNEDEQLEVIDGQQRLMSIRYFFEGYFGEAAKEHRKIFRLSELSKKSPYINRTFEELSSRDQRRLKNATLRAIHIKQTKPAANSDSVFHIFERLNSGGTRLSPQELRNVVYRGQIVSELRELNRIEDWRNILGAAHEDRKQRDIELILRLFSLFQNWQNYEKPMLSYLNNTMDANRNFDSERALQFQVIFPKVAKLICTTIDKPFRPLRVINAAMLEAFFISLMEMPMVSADRLRRAYSTLSQDDGFISSLRGATTDETALRKRITTVRVALADAAL